MNDILPTIRLTKKSLNLQWQEIQEYKQLNLIEYESQVFIESWVSYRNFIDDLGYLKVTGVPTFDEYRGWCKTYAPWRHGILCPGHDAWKPQYVGLALPMNSVYEGVKK